MRLGGQEVSLTATEFRLLEFLMSRPGVVFSREQLLDAVWGHDRAVTDRTVDVYILRLRQKIETDPTNPSFIRIVRGFGYSFDQRRRGSARRLIAKRLISYRRCHSNPNETIELFKQTGAYLRGHFRLTSGLHSPEYLQCALVLQYPDNAELLGETWPSAWEPMAR